MGRKTVRPCLCKPLLNQGLGCLAELAPQQAHVALGVGFRVEACRAVTQPRRQSPTLQKKAEHCSITSHHPDGPHGTHAVSARAANPIQTTRRDIDRQGKGSRQALRVHAIPCKCHARPLHPHPPPPPNPLVTRALWTLEAPLFTTTGASKAQANLARPDSRRGPYVTSSPIHIIVTSWHPTYQDRSEGGNYHLLTALGANKGSRRCSSTCHGQFFLSTLTTLRSRARH